MKPSRLKVRGRQIPDLISPLKMAGVAIAAPAIFFAATASARSQTDLAWPPRDVFHIAVRFIRVDRGCRITDKDQDSGYITFECDGDTPKSVKKGALELIPMEVQGRGGVRMQLTLADDPRSMELRFLELLERKLRDERGPALPPMPKPHPPSDPPADAGH